MTTISHYLILALANIEKNATLLDHPCLANIFDLTTATANYEIVNKLTDNAPGCEDC